MKELFILRGIPGCGKSTVSKSLIKGIKFADYYEADMYFYNEDGEYEFDAKMLKEAHTWCQGAVEDAMVDGMERIVVSNTSTMEREMEIYYKLAEDYGYTVFSLIVENRHGGKNIHGAPEDILDKMRRRFEIRL